MRIDSIQRYQRFARACLDVAVWARPEDCEKLHRIAETWLSLAVDGLKEASAAAKRRQRARSDRNGVAAVSLAATKGRVRIHKKKLSA